MRTTSLVTATTHSTTSTNFEDVRHPSPRHMISPMWATREQLHTCHLVRTRHTRFGLLLRLPPTWREPPRERCSRSHYDYHPPGWGCRRDRTVSPALPEVAAARAGRATASGSKLAISCILGTHTIRLYHDARAHRVGRAKIGLSIHIL